LRRTARIADALKEDFSTLILSGMREAAWIVPESCGFVKLPDWDGLHPVKAERVGRKTWVDLSSEQALAYRSQAILDAARLYRPDAFFADYLPTGQRRELLPLLRELACPRYLVHRGIADTSDDFVLRGEATREIAAYYDRILVCSDERLGDVAESDSYCEEARDIVRYVGFVTAAAEPNPPGERYVVCSAGGGYQAEEMMLACIEIARRHPAIPFRIVLGPRSRLQVAGIVAAANCDVRQYRDDLSDLHRDAAVVISAGGYNSVLEAAFGGATLIVRPNWTGDDDEQVRFADLLSRYHPVHRIESLDLLEPALLAGWDAAAGTRTPPLALKRDGGQTIRTILSQDLATGFRSAIVMARPHRPGINLDGFRDAARGIIAPDLFDYIDGGAGDELTRRANREDLDALRLAPLVFRDVAQVDPCWSSPLGRFALPVGLSPSALHRLVHQDGEIATARAARARGVPMIVSMMASLSIEEIAAESRHDALWLQTYVLKDRALGAELIQRATQAGYTAIVVSAGCPVMGKRDRNIANGFRLPENVNAANFRKNDRIDPNNPIHSFDGAALDPGVTWRDLEQLVANTTLPVFVKGIVNPRDVAPALAAGAAGIMVSNHGGRQLDGTISAIRSLPEIVDAVAGRVPVFIDGGIRRGTDVLKALALGADAVFLGSAVLWALAADGERGVATALEILGDEFVNALTLAGCADLADLRRNAATILRRPMGRETP
jgi:(S)-2-hydroxy-acid oxidase/4-hydroxymandelate oxidase